MTQTPAPTPAPDTDIEMVGFDLETTGLEARESRIVQAVVGDMNILLNPGVDIPQEALDVHGFTKEHLAAHGVDYVQGLSMISAALTEAWDRGALVVGHNIGYFDLPFLRAQESLFDLPRTRVRKFYDTYTEYKKVKHGEASGKLTSMCEAMGVRLDNAHEAGADAAASVECARILRNGWKPETPMPHIADTPVQYSAPSGFDINATVVVAAPVPPELADTVEHPSPTVPREPSIDPQQTAVFTAPKMYALNKQERLIGDESNDTIIKITYDAQGLPSTVRVCSPNNGQWTRSMTVRAGVGKEVLKDVLRIPPQSRTVPAHMAQRYGAATETCLLCGKPLSDGASLRRGFGDDCARKVR